MISDGADTSDAALDESIASLKARSIPVFTVGVGQEQFAQDIQVTRVETPRAVLKGTSLVVNVVLTQTGYAGATVPLNVEDEGRIVGTQEVTLPPDGESSTVRVRFTASDAGPRMFRISVPAQANEQVTQNNARTALIEVNDKREQILYFEGEPRPEPKFILRAVEDDKNLQIVLLQRTAENKYYRRGVDSGDVLEGGFPKTRDELFAYRALILGSVEAASFSPDQLRMIADFVSKRGGALLMLGGRRAFAEGGWAGTPVGEVLPVTLAAQPTPNYFSELSVRPTGRRQDQPGHPDRRRRGRIRETVAGLPAGHHGQPGPRRQAGRDHPAVGARQQKTGTGGAGVPALRPRQNAGDADSGLLAVAHERQDTGDRHDLRHVVAAPRPLAGR